MLSPNLDLTHADHMPYEVSLPAGILSLTKSHVPQIGIAGQSSGLEANVAHFAPPGDCQELLLTVKLGMLALAQIAEGAVRAMGLHDARTAQVRPPF